MNLPIPIFRNEINALGDFKGGVKVARDFAGWIKSQLGHRYGNLTEEEQEKRNALCKEDPAERPAHPGKVLDRSGLKPGSILAVSKEPPVLDALVQANASANIDFAEEGPADEGEAGAQ